MGKAVGSGFGSAGLSSFVPESGVCRLYKSVPFTEKRPQIPETGMKDGFEEIEHEFSFLPVEHSVGEKQDYLLGCFSLEPGSALGKKREKNWRAKQADSRQLLGLLCSPIFVLFVPVFSLEGAPPPPPTEPGLAGDVSLFTEPVRTKKSSSILPSKRIFRKRIVNCKQSTFRV